MLDGNSRSEEQAQAAAQDAQEGMKQTSCEQIQEHETGPDEVNPSRPHERNGSEILSQRFRRSPRLSCEDMTCSIHSELLATLLHQVTAFSYCLSLLCSNSIHSQYCGDILKNVFAQGAFAILVLSCYASVYHIEPQTGVPVLLMGMLPFYNKNLYAR